MSETMTEAVKRWTAKRKSALVVEIMSYGRNWCLGCLNVGGASGWIVVAKH